MPIIYTDNIDEIPLSAWDKATGDTMITYRYKCMICDLPFISEEELTSFGKICICSICNDRSLHTFPCAGCNGYLKEFIPSGIGINWLACPNCGGLYLHKVLVQKLKIYHPTLYKGRYFPGEEEAQPQVPETPRRLETD